MYILGCSYYLHDGCSCGGILKKWGIGIRIGLSNWNFYLGGDLYNFTLFQSVKEAPGRYLSAGVLWLIGRSLWERILGVFLVFKSSMNKN